MDLVRLVLDTVCENSPLATVALGGLVEYTAPKAEKLLNDEKSTRGGGPNMGYLSLE